MLATALLSPDTHLPNFDTDFRSGNQISDVLSPKSKDNGSSTAISNAIAFSQHPSNDVRAPFESISSQPSVPKKQNDNIINATAAFAAPSSTATVTTQNTSTLKSRRTVYPLMDDIKLVFKPPDNRDLQNGDTSKMNETASVSNETTTRPRGGSRNSLRSVDLNDSLLTERRHSPFVTGSATGLSRSSFESTISTHNTLSNLMQPIVDSSLLHTTRDATHKPTPSALTTRISYQPIVNDTTNFPNCSNLIRPPSKLNLFPLKKQENASLMEPPELSANSTTDAGNNLLRTSNAYSYEPLADKYYHSSRPLDYGHLSSFAPMGLHPYSTHIRRSTLPDLLTSRYDASIYSTKTTTRNATNEPLFVQHKHSSSTGSNEAVVKETPEAPVTSAALTAPVGTMRTVNSSKQDYSKQRISRTFSANIGISLKSR